MSAISISADPELEAMVRIARAASAQASELYREHLSRGIAVEEKSPGNPVTRADREIDRMIARELGERFPEATVIGEESAPAREELADLVLRGTVFFVDPIDGTREFVDRTGEFAVMIGLAQGGHAEAGVIALPSEGVLLAGRVGLRAFVERAHGERELVTVTTVDDFVEARMLVSRSHPPRIVEPLRRRLGIGRIDRCGSVGVKVARIARGLAELYVHGGHGLELWDTCAAEALLAAAGGRLTDLDGRRIDYATAGRAVSRGLVASNGVLHAGVMSAMAWAEREAERTAR